MLIGTPLSSETEAVYGTMIDNQEFPVIPIYEYLGKDREAHKFIVASEDENGNLQASGPALNVKTTIQSKTLKSEEELLRDTQHLASFETKGRI